MKSTVAAAAALAFAIAATTASAGVVISQNLIVEDQAATPKLNKTSQTVMVQGHKQKVITGDEEVITDLDAGKLYYLNPNTRQFTQIAFPPTGMYARKVAREGISVGFKKSGASPHKVNRYICQDYVGASQVANADVNVTECVASDAPGAAEFVEFRKAMAQKLTGTALAIKGEIPDGIPVSSTTNMTPTPILLTGGIPPEALAKIKEQLAKKKVNTVANVSRIETKNLPDDTFVVPAGYNKQRLQLPQVMPMPGMPPVTHGTAPSAPGPPPVPAAPAPH